MFSSFNTTDIGFILAFFNILCSESWKHASTVFLFLYIFFLERQGVGEGSKYILKVLTFLQAAFSNKKAIPVASTCEITKQN